MVVFDNLANILETIIEVQHKIDGPVCKEWKVLGEESRNRIVVGWIFYIVQDDVTQAHTCVGLYNGTKNTVKKMFTISGRINIIQATVSTCETFLGYVVRDDIEDVPTYKHFVASTSQDEPTLAHSTLECSSQIMSTFLESNKLTRLLIMIHNEAVWLYQVSLVQGMVEVVKRDMITSAFTWAQWDLATRCLYFINFRRSTVFDEDIEKQELSPTLTAFQFHQDMPHETVFNIPLNLPTLSKFASVGLYEDDCVPLRVHDCSLDLIVITDPSGMVCICHHYLYQPVKPPTLAPVPDIDDNVNFAYSVTLLHHGCVIHCTVPGVPWTLAKNLRPAFTLLGSQYLLIHGPGVLSHLLDIGMAHEPICHIHLPAKLESVAANSPRLVPLHSTFTENSQTVSDALVPSVMLDLNTLDLLEIEVTVQDILAAFEHIKNVSNRLSILHYFLVHMKDLNLVEEVLQLLITKPYDVDLTLYLQEILIGGTYSIAQRHLLTDTANMLSLLPMTSLHPSGKLEIKVDEKCSSVTQEILWNTAMMLLSPQQRLIPYRCDIWTRLWDKLSKFSEIGRFKHSYVADKLSVSLVCYQPEALSRCTTPMSPAAGVFPVCNFLDMSGTPGPTRKSACHSLPFQESDSCTASKQEHITSVNMRQLNMYLMRHCSREAPMHVHAVTTRYVTAQLDMSKQLCHILCRVAGLVPGSEKGFPLIRKLDENLGQILLTILLRYHHAANLLAFPLPQGFTSFFCYLGFIVLPLNLFLQHLNSNVFQLQVDVMKEILQESEDTKENVKMKLGLLLEMPRSRARRLLNTWTHPASLMLRAREHSLNVLSGVQSGKPKAHLFARRPTHASRGLTAFPSGDRVSPLDTFLEMLTAKASLTELDFNLLIEATVLSTEEFL